MAQASRIIEVPSCALCWAWPFALRLRQTPSASLIPLRRLLFGQLQGWTYPHASETPSSWKSVSGFIVRRRLDKEAWPSVKIVFEPCNKWARKSLVSYGEQNLRSPVLKQAPFFHQHLCVQAVFCIQYYKFSCRYTQEGDSERERERESSKQRFGHNKIRDRIRPVEYWSLVVWVWVLVFSISLFVGFSIWKVLLLKEIPPKLARITSNRTKVRMSGMPRWPRATKNQNAVFCNIYIYIWSISARASRGFAHKERQWPKRSPENERL